MDAVMITLRSPSTTELSTTPMSKDFSFSPAASVMVAGRISVLDKLAVRLAVKAAGLLFALRRRVARVA